MTMTAQDIGMNPRDPFMSGDTADFPVTISLPGDFDLSGVATIVWQVHQANGAFFTGPALITKNLNDGISIISATAPAVFNIHVAPADTEELAGLFYHEAEVRLTGGAVHTVFKGRCQITPDAVA